MRSHPAPPFDDRTASTTIPLLIDRDIVVRLRPAAIKRDLSVVRLVEELLDVIASDGLVGAVLDDGAGRPADD
jgi:hypothetical protein